MFSNRILTPSLEKGIILLLLLSISLLGCLSSQSVNAVSNLQTPQTPQSLTVVPMSNEECLACHETPDMFLPLPSGEELYLTVNRVLYNTSVHGRGGYACVQCHTEITGFPHPEFDAETIREFTLKSAETCGDCHTQEQEIYLQGDHAKTLAEGKLESAVCTDCHGAHEIQEFGSSGSRIARTCRNCHTEIFDIYQDSVHGNALLDDYDPFVPSCVDCHSNHDNTGPEEHPEFHLLSVQICAQCHADEELMSRYEVNTDVFDTYVADFHGSTVTIFEQIAPDQQTNKPVCVDCHGVHDIRPPDDTQSSVIKANLIDTCQRCHPEASADFPDSWLSHYPPDLEHNTIVFVVDLFYMIFIPGTILVFLVFIGADVWRRATNRRMDAQKEGLQ